MNELFEEVVGIPANPTHFALLELYVRAGNEADTLEQIADMGSFYPDPELAEVGFVVVWDTLLKR